MIQTNQPNLLIFMALINFALLATSTIMGYKLISLLGITLSAGTLIFPLSYVCGDMITELYGYRLSRIVIWTTFIALLIFSLLITSLLVLTPDANWHLQSAYHDVLHGTLRLSLAIIISLIIGDFVNAYLLSTWKIRLHGKSFWLRSFGSTAIGETIDTLIGIGICVMGIAPLSHYLQLVFAALCVKFIYNAIFIIPSSLIVAILKQKLELDVFDYHTNFNPFKFN